MLGQFVGFMVALCVFGLPLGAIGLFILSIVDQWDDRTDKDNRRSYFIYPKSVRWPKIRSMINGMTLTKRGKTPRF
jgi:hypothetical protein